MCIRDRLQAVLQKQKLGIGFCRTATQKKQVLSKLKNFVKLTGLVSLNDGPVKDVALLMYERQLRHNPS